MSREKNSQQIQVYVRSRPLNIQEKASTVSVVDTVPEQKEVRIRERYGPRECSKVFKFDKVFGPSSTQADVFDTVMTPVIEEVLMGYSCAVFVYGQTGSGKTYTMEGEHSSDVPWEKNSKTGIIPRTLSQLFDNLQKQELDYALETSFVELYNEEVFDLLSSENGISKLRLFEDIARKGSVKVEKLEAVTVHSKEKVLSILERGSSRRKTAATNMNASSSRSHTIFSVTVHMKETTNNGDELLKTGKLNLVDLAGSENISRSGSVDVRAREAGSINQSLLTLGRVITALIEKAPHIPYRESKLTRLLQDSLGGKTKTTMIATISPAAIDLDETLSTLEYARRAKKITNCPEVNQKTTKQALLKEYSQEIERLKRDVAAAREKNGIFINPGNYQDMQQELLCKEETVKELNARIEFYEAEKEKVNMLFAKTKEEVTMKTTELETHSKELEVEKRKQQEELIELENTKEVLSKTELERAEQANLAEERTKTVKKLKSQTKKLTEIAEESTSDVCALHAKLDRKSAVEVANQQHNSEFAQRFDQRMRKLRSHLTQLCMKHRESSGSLLRSLDKTMETYEGNSKLLSAMISELVPKHATVVENAVTELSQQAKTEDEWRANLANLALKHEEEAVNSCNKYTVENFSPVLDEIISIHHGMDDQICKMKELFHLQHTQQAENIKKYIEEFGEDIEEFKNQFSLHCSSVENQLKQCAEFAESYEDYLANVTKQYEESNAEMEKVTSSLNDVTENFIADLSSSLPKISQGLSQVLIDSGNYKSNVERRVEQMAVKNDTFKKRAVEETRNNMLYAENNMKRISDNNSEILNKSNIMKTNVTSFQDCTTQVWDNYIDFLQKNLDEYAETEKQNLAKNLQLIEDVDCLITNAQRHHEEVLNTHKKDFESKIQSQKTESSTLDKIMQHEIESLQKDVEECNEDINSYATNWKADTPTGETPQRKAYICPKLVESSPAERIIQRFRNSISSQVANRKSPLEPKQSEGEDHQVPIEEIGPKKTYTTDSSSLHLTKVPKRILQQQNECEDHQVPVEGIGLKKTYTTDSSSLHFTKVPKRILQQQNESEDHQVPTEEIGSKKTYTTDSSSLHLSKLPKRILQVERSEDKENAPSSTLFSSS